MKYSKDNLRGRYTMRRLRFKKSPKNISINFDIAMFRMSMISPINIANLSRVVDSFLLQNSNFLHYGGHLNQTSTLLEFSSLDLRIPPIVYSVFYNSLV